MRPLAIIYKRGRELSPAVSKFIEVLTSSKIPILGQTKSGDQTKVKDKGERPPEPAEKVA